MAFLEDIVPECRSSAHPPHTDKRRWMKPVRETDTYVVWTCQRCSEIAHSAAIQVRMMPKGWRRAQWRNRLAEQEKQRLLADGIRGRVRVNP